MVTAVVSLIEGTEDMQRIAIAGAIVAAFICIEADADELRSISVTGHGEVEAEPDMAMIRLSVIELDADLINAKQSVDRKLAALREAIKTSGVVPESIRVSPHDIDPQYEEINGKTTVTGYAVRQSVSVGLSDTTVISAFLDKAILAGANRIRDIEFLSSRDTEIREEALQNAIVDSKRRASRIAEGFGARLGRVIRIDSEERESLGNALYSVEIVASEPDAPPKITVDSKIHVVFELID